MRIISTLKDIARHLGVSYSTVSRAFDPSSRVGQTTRKRVLDYAEQISFHPNLIAQSLKKSETKTVGIIIPSLDNIFYIEVLQQIEIALKSYGYRLLISFVQTSIASERDCLELMMASQVDAIIFIPLDRNNSDYVLKLMRSCYLTQLFNVYYDEIDSISMNDNGGARLGAEYLFKHGHRRILYIGGSDRVNGFLEAADNYQISRTDICIKDDWLTTPQEISEAILEFRPTSVFAIAYTAEAAWRAISDLRMEIPKDISLIVYDDTKWISILDITAVAHDLEDVANTLVNQIMRKLRTINDNGFTPEKIILSPFIKERNSVCILR